MNNSTNPMFSKFDQALGVKTPTTSAPVRSRADEIRALAKTSTVEGKSEGILDKIVRPETLKGETSFEADTETSNPTENIARTVGNIPSSAAKLARNVAAPVNPLDVDSPINIGSNIVKSVDAARDIYKDRGFIEGTKDIVKGAAETAVDLFKKPGEFIVEKAMNPTKTLQEIAEVGVEDPLLIPSLIYGGARSASAKADGISSVAAPVTRGVDTSVASVASKTKGAVEDAVTALTKKSEDKINSQIVEKFDKGVKPSITSKNTPAKAENYKKDVVSAVRSIKENQPNLSFVDETGEVVKGQAPKSLQQFSDAIEQTKKSIYEKYDALARQAGESGVSVKLNPISSELDTVISDKALNLSNPKAVKYAQELKDRLSNAGELDAETAQKVIQNYNKSLEAFYRNPSYDSASQAAIDALIVNKMRESLDKGITGLTGESYAALKKQYGSLKSIEKDVVKSTIRNANKSTKGLIDYSDILSGGQVVNGLVSLNPALIASGVTQKAITQFYKYLNNPNRAIQKMFEIQD